MTEPNRRALRTTVQVLFAMAAALPLLAGSPGLADIPAAATVVAAAGVLSRLMTVPAVERLLPGWLRQREGADGEQ
ncbi:hypothetical protein [Streptomyces sp. NPDC050535]|uniref:hypothetical protein n=1 Tax=Streptomyces sp. NPDC050535 TaxID=3365626 RepID=UPI0037B72F96